MTNVSFYFQLHQPFRIKPYSFFEIGHEHNYLDERLNKSIVCEVADNCYLPANQMMLDLIKAGKGKFNVSYSISGVLLEQLEAFRPDVIASFSELAETGCVEFLCETYYHSLSYFYSKSEFVRQVKKHRSLIKRLFNQSPTVFRNTELLYDSDLVDALSEFPFQAVLAEGLNDSYNPNYLFRAIGQENDLKVILRNYKLSDDIAFRFNDHNWEHAPLSPETYLNWIKETKGDSCNIFMDYETFGEHHDASTGVFSFFDETVKKGIKQGFQFNTCSQLLNHNKCIGFYDRSEISSWADSTKDITAWRGNSMQNETLKKCYDLEAPVKASGRKDLLDIWSKLQTSDHFYYLATKGLADSEVHNYFSPFETPYDAYIHYINVLSDLELAVNKALESKDDKPDFIEVSKINA